MKSFKTLILISAVLMSFAFTWPWDANKQKPNDANKKPKKATKEESSQSSSEGPSVVRAYTPPIDPELSRIISVQQDLAKIVDQTERIQTQSHMDRIKLQEIVEQAQSNRKLLESLKTPVAVTAASTVSENTIREAKVQVIAKEVEEAEKSLRSIQRAPKSEPVANMRNIPER